MKTDMIERPHRAESDLEFEAVLEGWRLQGRELVSQHWAEFQSLVRRVETAVAREQYAAAAAAAQVAAAYGVFWHPGAFVSHRLERALGHIGAAVLPCPGGAPAARRSAAMRVLHVATQVAGIGGHSRNLWRWIAADRQSVHSVVLTRQTDAVPEALSTAVAASGGTIRRSNATIGGPLAWAAALQPHLARADVVVLHVHNQDIVPFLALAGMKRRPRVVLHNHADHVFWIGSGFVDAVVNTRWSGHALCAARRDIAEERNLTVPICLEPVTRRLDRTAAKAALGLDPDAIVLLTVARSVKFRPIGGLSYADAVLPILKDNPKARLIAVGPGGVADWSAAEAQVPGRIVAHAETPHTGTFYEAADIYLDSFPFSSNTSLLEAGLHGLPLVTRQPFGSGCEVMGADSIGIDETLQVTRSLDAFQSAVRRLVERPDERRALGDATRGRIEAVNTGAGYVDALAEVYDRLYRLPLLEHPRHTDAGPRFDPVDLYSPFVFGSSGNPARQWTPWQRRAFAVEVGLKTMPPVTRLREWARLARRQGFAFRSTAQSWKYLVPEWLTVRARQLRGGGL